MLLLHAPLTAALQEASRLPLPSSSPPLTITPPPLTPDPTLLRSLTRTRGRSHTRYAPDALLPAAYRWAQDHVCDGDIEREAWQALLAASADAALAPWVALQIWRRHPSSTPPQLLLDLFGTRLCDGLRHLHAEVHHISALAMLLEMDPAAAIPRLGFDTRGERALPYGGRVYRLRVLATNTVDILKPDGSPAKALPARLKGADPDQLWTLRNAVSSLRRFVLRLPELMGAWLEEDLIAQIARPWPVWRALLVGHPLLYPLRNMVFQDTDSRQLLLLTEEGELIDERLRVVSPPAMLRLAHPDLLPADTRKTWAALQDEAGPAPFAPLRRAGRLLSGAALDQLSPLSIPAAPVVTALQRQGWTLSPPNREHRVFGAERRFRGGFQVSLRHSGHYGRVACLNERDTLRLQGVSFSRVGRPLHWRAVPPTIVSAVVSTLQAAAPARIAPTTGRRVVRRRARC